MLIIEGNIGRKRNIEGIEFRKEAKYLGVKYNKTLDPSLAIREFRPKINYIFWKVYKVLKNADIRSRFNIWQIFVLPLLRMALSMIGVANSQRC